MENKYIKLIKKYDEYIAFLHEAMESPISMARVHGWSCPQKDIDKGEQFRKEISDLKEKINWHPEE